jgi:hypothetical protein
MWATTVVFRICKCPNKVNNRPIVENSPNLVTLFEATRSVHPMLQKVFFVPATYLPSNYRLKCVVYQRYLTTAILGHYNAYLWVWALR